MLNVMVKPFKIQTTNNFFQREKTRFSLSSSQFAVQPCDCAPGTQANGIPLSIESEQKMAAAGLAMQH